MFVVELVNLVVVKGWELGIDFGYIIFSYVCEYDDWMLVNMVLVYFLD